MSKVKIYKFTLCRNCNLRFQRMDKYCPHCGRRTEDPTSQDLTPKPDGEYGGSEPLQFPAMSMQPINTKKYFEGRTGHPIFLGGKNGSRLRSKSRPRKPSMKRK